MRQNKFLKYLFLITIIISIFSFPLVVIAQENGIEGVLNDTDAGGELNIYHWWTAGGEKEAIDSAINIFREKYPNVKVVSNGIPGGAGGAMVMKVKVLALAGNSPETFQAHPGYELQPYLESGLLHDLSELWSYADLESRLLKGIAEMCKFDGRYYIVPIGVHKTNMVYYNKKIFEEYNITPPEEPVSWEDFWALCDELRDKLPPDKYPLDLGDRKNWPATQVFETIMVGTDPQIYEDFINGKASAEDIQKVLDNMKKFMNYVAPDHAARLWYEAAGRLVAGDYGMMMHGSWIQAYFKSQGWEYGRDYGAFSAPGTSKYFGLCVDAFVVPENSAGLENGLRWVYTISTPELQQKFTKEKESVSPYNDTSVDIYDSLTNKFLQELLDEEIVTYPSFTHGIALPWHFTMDLHSRISDFATNSNPDTARYAKLITDSLKESGVEGEWKIED